MVTTTALEDVNLQDQPKEPTQPSKARISEQMDFTWQKRVYCSREVEFYGKESNCRTHTAKRHHEVVKQILEDFDGTVPESRLYSCVASDEMVSEFERDLFVDDRRPCPTKLSTEMKDVQARCPMNFRRRMRDPFSSSSINIVDYNPSKETQLRNRLIATPTETMFILADLNQNDDKKTGDLSYSPSDYQYVLVMLKWQPLWGTLIVLPDFLPDVSNNGYSIKLSHDLMNIEYRYWVQNVSISCSLDQQLLSKKLLSLGSSHLKTTADLVFGIPEKSTLESFVFVELETATKFDSDPVFVLYYVDLPPGWAAHDPKSLYGATHLCYARNDVVVFSHLLELKLILNFASIDIDTTRSTEYSIPQPCLYLEVCSLDNWGRYRVLGYTHTYIAQIPGVHLVTLNTWRPSPSSIKEKLKYFFIGANKQLSHITYSGAPKSFEGSLLSKYGFETIASGDISLKINVVHQINQSILESTGKRPRHLMDQMSCSSLVNSVNAVLEAFHKARQRMLIAKTPLIEHHLDSSYNDNKSSDSQSSGQDD